MLGYKSGHLLLGHTEKLCDWVSCLPMFWEPVPFFIYSVFGMHMHIDVHPRVVTLVKCRLDCILCFRECDFSCSVMKYAGLDDNPVMTVTVPE